MAILIIEQQGNRQAGTLSGRVLIGRWPGNTLVIDDKSVSRVHAWIGVQEGQFYIADTGSRTGTFVNGEPLHQRHALKDGDHIRVGPAGLTYLTDELMAAGANKIDLSPRTPSELSDKHGVFMDCVCGAPLWLPEEFVGTGQCRYCGHTISHGLEAPIAPPAPIRPANARPLTPAIFPPPLPIPDQLMKPAGNVDDDFDADMNDSFAKNKALDRPGRQLPPTVPTARPIAREPGPVIPTIGRASSGTSPTAVAEPVATTSAGPRGKSTFTLRAEKDRVCGICHSPVTVFDEITNCPSCGLRFHTDCWAENHGCSAYGCLQVGEAGNKGI